MKNFIEELEWRGMIHTVMPGADEELKKGMASAYLGIDPTADSLHIGHLVGVMILIALCAGVWCWWFENFDDSKQKQTKEEKKEVGGEEK